MSRDLRLHFLQPPRVSPSSVRSCYHLVGVRFKRRRPPAENVVLDAHRQRAIVHELQGDLRFATIECLIRELVNAHASLRYAVLDLRRVTRVDAARTQMLAQLVDAMAGRWQHFVLTRVLRGDLLGNLAGEFDPRSAKALSYQPQLDLGMEWWERGVVERYSGNCTSR